ncbi:hypothetical protein [Desulfococcus sp.]|uniref:hypothetical protein n=1 Tax=Desulfococcus sp. TaxID=2025834 RepID=UPI003593FA0D
MDRCPACNADVRERTVCRRCKTDLSVLTAVEEQAARHAEDARCAFRSGDFSRMFLHAKRACSLRSTRESRRLLAAAALLTRRYRTAIGLWRPQRH